MTEQTRGLKLVGLGSAKGTHECRDWEPGAHTRSGGVRGLPLAGKQQLSEKSREQSLQLPRMKVGREQTSLEASQCCHAAG